jgi:hypothetical protein
LTFKDLKKRVTLEAQQQQSMLFERLQNKPFWIWNIDEHKREDINTDADCCFNHIIGLPQKDGDDMPLFDYQQILFNSLDSGNTHLWIKLWILTELWIKKQHHTTTYLMHLV